MNFSDIFKNSFLEKFDGTSFDLKTIALLLIVSSVLAIYIFLVYRGITKKTFYSKTFNISLVALTIIITSIIITIQSNIVISLGMVGALSIVRFRTAIKDPMDLTFLFWSISVGIICGANLPELALVESLVLTVLILVLNYLPVSKAPMLLIINFDDINTEDKIINILTKYIKHYKIKSRNISNDKEEMIIELRIKNDNSIVKEISKIKNVQSVSLLSHDGEITV